MGHIAVTGLAYAHPGGDPLFEEVTFKVAPGQTAGLVGVNGVGKSTLLRVIAGELQAEAGESGVGGRLARMPQDVGTGDDARTVRELLLVAAPSSLRDAGERMAGAEQALAAGEAPEVAGVALGEAIADWSELGGYELEARWDEACRRVVRAGLDEVGPRPAGTLSGGERKQLVLAALLASDADVLLLDEPDNFLDIPAKRELERALAGTPKTVLLISHDRAVLRAAVGAVVTLEGRGAWTHPGSYATYREAREARQRKLGDALQRWRDEERRLRELVRKFKERAKYSSDWAKKADAMETRWKRFTADGPPPAPVGDRQIKVRLRGGDSARRVLALRHLAIPGLVAPVDDEVHFGERVGLVGPNGSGKSHLLRLLAGEDVAHEGELLVGPRVSPGLFTQLNVRPDLMDRVVLDAVQERTGNREQAMQGLARYDLQTAAHRPYRTLSGGQRARLEVLLLEIEGHNLLLLDEPTDNLDVESCEALEAALEEFEGTVVAVSHDRAFLERLDRFLLVPHAGPVRALPDPRAALEALGA
ncbi:ABC-F family ATP-binding cassette domain-containing protein [Conexibacter sp. SYSU D00693]|uniref:ABC-F family ATP-binding cassette domain-containing protein n=1 Tax=Conexibacter sp. SYSU D00693 TaxID=2812560 RepID=UPI00196A73A8|nr:ABC-F family ATP-binding cassette domain-containing protein [Conexibacter sp. SYSU D00693]